MFGMSVLWPGCGSVSGAFQLCRSHMGGTCVRPPHSQPERRIVIIRQEANPMKTVATLLAGSRNGEAGFEGGKNQVRNNF